MLIREATSDDAGTLIALFQRLYAETQFLLYQPGESVPQIDEYAQRISEVARREDGVMFVAQSETGIVGVIFGNRGAAKKTRHSLFVVMGVLRASWNQGVGYSLLKTVEDWAVAHDLRRLELTVQTTNARAVGLYERAGFEREGTKRHSLRIDGKFVDEYLMSKLIAA